MAQTPGVVALLLLLASAVHSQVLKYDQWIPKDAVPERLNQRELDEERRFKVLKAGEFNREGDTFKASGGVHFQFRDYDVKADAVDGDLATEIFELEGNIHVVGKDLDVKGESGTLRAKEREVAFRNARGSLGPQLIKNGLSDNIYIRGSGEGSEQQYTLTDSGCTTCSLDHPHWELRARTIQVIPNERLVLRGVGVRILGRTRLSLPYVSLPLDRDLPRYLPEFGQSADEGVFVKTRFGLDTRGTDLLDARVDLLSRLGLGLGTELKYALGSAALYGIFGPNQSLVGNIDHRQKVLGAEGTLNLNYSQRNYLTAPDSTTLSSRAGLQWRPLRVNFNRSTSQTGTFRSESQTVSVAAQPRLAGWQMSVDGALQSSLSRSTNSDFRTDRSVFDLRLRGNRSFRSVDADFLYSRSIPISEINNFFNAGDQTPLLTMNSNSGRLLGGKSRWPLTFSVGELSDPVRRSPLSRMSFETSAPNQTVKSGRATLNTSGRFRQNLYSDDTAQFLLGYDAGLAYQTTGVDSLRINYRYLRAQGFAPLSGDRTGRSDALSVDFATKLPNDLSLTAGTGYDFLDRSGKVTPWQTLITRVEWNRDPTTSARLFMTYDPVQQVWQSLRFDTRFTGAGDSRFAVGLRYDGTRSRLGSAALLAENVRFGKLTLNALLNYNGFTKRLDSHQYEAIWDMHCSEAILTWQENRTGFRNGRTINFTIRLKAFPFGSNFGTGTRGQSVFGSNAGLNF